MQTNQKKVKLMIFSAIALIAILLTACTVLLISIHSTNNKLKQQQMELDKLNNQIKHYEQIADAPKPDNSITEDN